MLYGTVVDAAQALALAPATWRSARQDVEETAEGDGQGAAAYHWVTRSACRILDRATIRQPTHCMFLLGRAARPSAAHNHYAQPHSILCSQSSHVRHQCSRPWAECDGIVANCRLPWRLLWLVVLHKKMDHGQSRSRRTSAACKVLQRAQDCKDGVINACDCACRRRYAFAWRRGRHRTIRDSGASARLALCQHEQRRLSRRVWGLLGAGRCGLSSRRICAPVAILLHDMHFENTASQPRARKLACWRGLPRVGAGASPAASETDLECEVLLPAPPPPPRPLVFACLRASGRLPALLSELIEGERAGDPGLDAGLEEEAGRGLAVPFGRSARRLERGLVTFGG